MVRGSAGWSGGVADYKGMVVVGFWTEPNPQDGYGVFWLVALAIFWLAGMFVWFWLRELGVWGWRRWQGARVARAEWWLALDGERVQAGASTPEKPQGGSRR